MLENWPAVRMRLTHTPGSDLTLIFTVRGELDALTLDICGQKFAATLAGELASFHIPAEQADTLPASGTVALISEQGGVATAVAAGTWSVRGGV